MNFRGHVITNTVLTTAVVIGSRAQFETPYEYIASFSIGVIFASIFLSPDLDLTISSPYKNFGPLRFIWFPYAKLFKHRGISHSYFLGTFTRIAYLAIGLSALLAGSIYLLDTVLNILRAEILMGFADQLSALALHWKDILGVFIIGVVFSDFCHVTTDRSWSKIKAIF